LLRAAGGFQHQPAGQIECSRRRQRSGLNQLRSAFTVDHGKIHVRTARDHAAVHRDPVARRDCQMHARFDLIERKILAAAVGPDHHRAARRQPHQIAHRRTRPLTHHVIERPACQQEEQKRDRGIEIGMLAMGDGLMQRNRIGKQDAQT
jgi:hypothetical protein